MVLRVTAQWLVMVDPQKITIKMFSISLSEICDERTTSCLGWFNATRRSCITPKNLIDSAKLYDYYVNGFNDSSKSAHTARVHLSKSGPSSHISSAPATHSAPTLMDLVHADNVEPQDADISVLEEQWFNHPDLYDLSETEHVDEELQATMIQTSQHFDVADYMKLNDPKLVALIKSVDTTGPGAAVAPAETKKVPIVGKPGEWSIDSFLWNHIIMC